MINLENFKEYMPRQLLITAQHFLKEGHTISISESDNGCYDALICRGMEKYWVEVTLELDSDSIIEDSYCSKCNSLLCVHTIAVLQLISENKKALAEERFKK